MVRQRRDIVHLQELRQLFHLLAAEAIYDAAFATPLAYEAYDVAVYVLSLGTHLIVEVRAVERRLEQRGFAHAKVFLNIVAHLGGCSRSKSNERTCTYFINNRTYAPVLRTEIMPPLRNAVGFVNSVERNLYTFEKLYIVFFRKGFRRYIKQLRTPGRDIGLHLVDSRTVQRRIEEMGHTVILTESAHCIHLVLH